MTETLFKRVAHDTSRTHHHRILSTITDFLAFEPSQTNSNYIKIIEPTTAAQLFPEEEFNRSIALMGATDIESFAEWADASDQQVPVNN